MFFNSFDYLFYFLPLVLAGYFACGRWSALGKLPLMWLLVASLFFYAWWNPWNLPIIVGSMGFNFAVGQWIQRYRQHWQYRRSLLWAGIAGNLLLLGYYKYLFFVGGAVGQVLGVSIDLPHLLLPLGISFFTFTQIAYLVDTARGEVQETQPLHYALFVTFFPHLLAGPILHHREMMPQFADAANRRFNAENVARGLFLLAMGLGKKVLIADPLAGTADAGFADPASLSTLTAWQTTLAYSLQIYFDFSGYTDMALGVAWMFNIRLPLNFDSPYRATNLQDFWRRWHMTLSRFLRDYVYVPLGGGRGTGLIVSRNVLLTFLVGGLWHGAGWTFLVWGALHGVGMVVVLQWRRLGWAMPTLLAWALTLLFVHLTWVFFRADSWQSALTILRALVPNDWAYPSLLPILRGFQAGLPLTPSMTLVVAGVLCLLPVNSNRLAERFAGRVWEGLVTVLLLTLGVLSFGRVSPFLYFNF